MTSTYGQGPITFERGRYRLRLPNGRGGYKEGGTFKTRELAERARAASLAVSIEVSACPTLRAYGETYLARCADQENARTWRNTWDNHVLAAPFIDEPMEDVAPRDIDAFLRQLVQVKARRSVLQAGERTSIELDRVISQQTAQHVLGLLRRCFKAAVRDGYLTSNPTDGAKLPRSERRPARAKGAPFPYLVARQIEQLFALELPPEQRAVFTVAIHQGLREGEIAALRWENIDIAQHGWWITASWDGDEGSTKTGEVRFQPLQLATVAELQAWWGLRGRPERGLIFPARRGRAPIQRGFSIHERAYAEGFDWGWAHHPEKHVTRLGWWHRAGIRTRVPFHGLRDTCATHLLSGTWGPRMELIDVSRFLGHSDPKVTAQRYAHLTRDAQRAAVLALRAPARRRGNDGTGGAPGGLLGSGTPPTPATNLPQRSAKTSASPGGFEPPAFGLGTSSANRESPEKTPDLDAAWQVCGRLARQVTEAAARGEVPHALIAELARAAAGVIGVAFEGAEVEGRTLEIGLRLATLIGELCAEREATLPATRERTS